MYTVFMTRKEKIIFSDVRLTMYGIFEETAKGICSRPENRFFTEEKSIDEIHKMIEDGFAFFPLSEKTKAKEIKRYTDMGFKIAFVRVVVFRKLRKDYREFI